MFSTGAGRDEAGDGMVTDTRAENYYELASNDILELSVASASSITLADVKNMLSTDLV